MIWSLIETDLMGFRVNGLKSKTLSKLAVGCRIRLSRVSIHGGPEMDDSR